MKRTSPPRTPTPQQLSRRSALSFLGLGAASVACSGTEDVAGDGGLGGAAGSAGGTAAGGAAANGSCDLVSGWASGGTRCMTDVASYPNPFGVAATLCPTKPDLTLGPCHRESPERVDVSNGLPGVPVRMALRVVDSSCAPVAGAIVEIWHTNYKGGYSGDIAELCTLEQPDKDVDFFRGYQVSDDEGVVYFNSCFPGSYPGRAIHVHVRVLIDASTTADDAPAAAITQLLWADELVDAIFTDVPLYAAFGTPDTHLTNDGVLSGASDKSAFVFDVEQMSDGAMLCSKTLVVDP